MEHFPTPSDLVRLVARSIGAPNGSFELAVAAALLAVELSAVVLLRVLGRPSRPSAKTDGYDEAA